MICRSWYFTLLTAKMSGVLAQIKVPQVMFARMSQKHKNFAVTLGSLTYNCTAGPSMQVSSEKESEAIV